FTRFQQNGLLEAEGKEVRILDSIGLCALAGGAMDV
ncbi:MAG TPA: transcriptional regulator FNR, partial [Pseudomonas sp.]|nr:transcriptional regulator FNR [Pseudomonas sp.]